MKGSSDIEGTLKQEPVLVTTKGKDPVPGVEELEGAALLKWVKTLSQMRAKL